MKKTCISKGWSLHSPHYQGPIDLPNDYSVTAPREKMPREAVITATLWAVRGGIIRI